MGSSSVNSGSAGALALTSCGGVLVVAVVCGCFSARVLFEHLLPLVAEVVCGRV